MKDYIRIYVIVSLIIFEILSVVDGLRDPDANEVSSCTEVKDGTEYIAQWANDGDASTCARTCFQTGSWIRVTLNASSHLITKVIIRGYLPKYTQIRIGGDKSDVGFRDGFSNNAPCILQTGTPTSDNQAITDHVFQCSVPRSGTVLSFKSGDTDSSPQLILCNVVPEYQS